LCISHTHFNYLFSVCWLFSVDFCYLISIFEIKQIRIFMKSKILTLLAISFLSFTVVSGQNISKQKDPVGIWKFEAPYAPVGFNSGTIVVGIAEKKNTTTMSFTGSEFKIEGEKVKTANDSITFSVYVEGQDVKVFLKIENDTTMSGKAVYAEGEIPLTLTKTVGVD